MADKFAWRLGLVLRTIRTGGHEGLYLGYSNTDLRNYQKGSLNQMMENEELQEFRAWKRAKDKNELEEAFHALEESIKPGNARGYNCVMPSLAYKTLAVALLALKKELLP